jgi:hypothetical protein
MGKLSQPYRSFGGVPKSGDGSLAFTLALGEAPSLEEAYYLDRKSILASAQKDSAYLHCAGWFKRAAFARDGRLAG